MAAVWRANLSTRSKRMKKNSPSILDHLNTAQERTKWVPKISSSLYTLENLNSISFQTDLESLDEDANPLTKKSVQENLIKRM